MRTKCFCYVVALVTVLADTASATEKTAPLVPVFSPTRPAEIITRFHDAFGSGLAAGGMSTFSAADVRAKVGAVEQAGCAKGSCVTAFGAKLGTQRVATAHISTVGKNYNIKAGLFVGRSLVATIEQRCDICTVSEALRSMTKAGRDLAKKAAAQAAAVPKAPPAEPAKPPVTDTPPKPETPPEVRPETHPVPEAPVTKSDQTDTSSKGWPLWPALVSAGVGVVGLAVGIPLLSLDGDATNCVGTPRADNRNCADLYDTAGGGWLMTGVGITAVVASGVLFYLYFKKGNREAASTTVSLVPTDGGMVLGAHGSF